MRLRATISALAALVSTAAAAVPPASATAPGADGRIATTTASFVEQRCRPPFYCVNKPRLTTLNPDGTGLQRLPVRFEGQTAPAFSPDGRSVAVRTLTAEGYELWVLGIDGADPRRLGAAGDGPGPDWSPDGARILFGVGTDSDPTSDNVGSLRVADGTLTRMPIAARSAVWSPSGTRLA